MILKKLLLSTLAITAITVSSCSNDDNLTQTQHIMFQQHIHLREIALLQLTFLDKVAANVRRNGKLHKNSGNKWN
jgi:hypothetical protein